MVQRVVTERVQSVSLWWFGLTLCGLLGLQLSLGLVHRSAVALLFVVSMLVWGLACCRVRFLDDSPSRLSASAIVVTMVALLAVALCVEPATSKDVNSYAIYGRMLAVYDASPYVHLPLEFSSDPWFSRMSPHWSDVPSIYGPVFTAISALIVWASDGSLRAGIFGFQFVAALAHVGATALVWSRTRRLLAVVAVGWNPLIVAFGVNDAHADVLMGFAVVGAVLALDVARQYVSGHELRRSVWLVVGAVLLVLAAGVKITALAALGGALIWVWSLRAKQQRMTDTLVFGGSALFMLAVLYLAGGGQEMIEAVRDASSRHSRFSLWNPVIDVVSRVAYVSTAERLVGAVGQVVVVAVGIWGIWKFRQRASVAAAVCVGLVAYQVLGVYTLAWYSVWGAFALSAAWGLGRETRVAESVLWAVAIAHGSWLAVAYLNGYVATFIAVMAAILGIALARKREQTQERNVLERT